MFNRDMTAAPKDGTLLLLLVEGGEHKLEDVGPGEAWPTIGFNNFDHDGEDVWKFAGWCWSHDHFVAGDEHGGTVVGWALYPSRQSPAQASSQCAEQLDRVFIGQGEYVRADQATATIMRLQAEIAALSASTQRPSEPSDWQDIATAPKDGTIIQVWGSGWTPHARWGQPQHECGEYGRYCDSCPTDEGWIDDTFNYELEEEPTHWMHLPKPPASVSEEPSRHDGEEVGR